jgi:urease accessory protein
LVSQTAAKALETSLDQASSATFASDIAAMRHETLETRIFRT